MQELRHILRIIIGLIMGMKSAGWNDVPLVTMETVGADCFNQTLEAGRIVKIDAIRR